ncbi:hypothetical protein UFOVP538_23 [uncultured Caudovirales phage]|uniref:Uncharacterized protein n=1 Tax=uncultured Caudovirales phage TaxID=2100421 RepID=A0A6J5MWA6_9CAUD|nr:hypothetical protein UFOVP538_23 [uncultured Caudovirales phage]
MLNTIASLHGGGAAAVSNSYESIATVTLTGTQASIEFTSIAATYSHLQIRLMARSNRSAVVNDSLHLQLNSDTGTNYDDHYLIGDGSSAGAGAETSVSNISLYRITGAGAGTNTFGVSVIDILDYKNTNKYKTVRALTGDDNNGDGRISLGSGLWRNTAAITSIKLFPNNGSSSFVQYSTIALYGIKG